jgi:hypothetical protein
MAFPDLPIMLIMRWCDLQTDNRRKQADPVSDCVINTHQHHHEVVKCSLF